MAALTGTPLDKKEIIDDSSNIPVPAIHKMWAKKWRFVGYVAPPRDTADQGLMGEWLERLEYISTDLHWLLQLPYHKFWCQVIFDESLHLMLDSFLQYSPRPFDVDFGLLTDESRKLHDQVTRLVFFTYLRMATYKESKDNWLTPEVYGDIIYENFLFDISKVLDLCGLYGHSNTALLSKMVANIFSQQPKYLDDLRSAVPTILQVFVNIAGRCGLEQDPGVLTPQKLTSEGRKPVDLINVTDEDFEDVILYLADTAITVSSFLHVYPQACHVLHDLHFCPDMARMYEKLIPALENAMKHRSYDTVRMKKAVHRKLSEARVHLLTAFHLVVSHVSLQPVLETVSTKDDNFDQCGSTVDKYLEHFLTLMSSILGEKRFLADYEGLFSFQDDMDIFLQAAGDLDETHYKFILEAINSAFAAHGKRKTPKGNTNRGGRTSPDGSTSPPTASVQFSAQSTSNQSQSTSNQSSCIQPILGAEAVVKRGVELDSLVCAVKDVLPYLGTAFIQRALEELNYDVEGVISAVLEDKLPASLQDTNTLTDRPCLPETTGEEFSVVDSRRNIYDNDQFDIFNNPHVDMQHIHKGKRMQEESVLESKESVQELRALYDAYGSMDVRSMYEPQLYEDEYDDTYDVNDVGAEDADSADELTQRRPFTTPQVLRKKDYELQNRDSSEESTEENEEKRRDLFVQDPAKLREIQEQKRMAHNVHQPQKTFDTKGKAKGQGQTKEVTQNRKHKDKNKAQRANHNRRALADKKHSKGMF